MLKKTFMQLKTIKVKNAFLMIKFLLILQKFKSNSHLHKMIKTVSIFFEDKKIFPSLIEIKRFQNKFVFIDKISVCVKLQKYQIFLLLRFYL